MGITHKVHLPTINNTNGPFRLALILTSWFVNFSSSNSHLYIVVIDIDYISGNTKRTVTSVEDISTEQLIEESKKISPLYYVAAVIRSDQYETDHTMSYILGAGDNTTDIYGNVFHNRELRRGMAYFFRVFSVDSSSEVNYTMIKYTDVILYLYFYRMRFQLLQSPKVSTQQITSLYVCVCVVWVYVCMHVCVVRVCVCVCMHVCMCVYVSVHAQARMCICVCACVCVCMCICICVYACARTCACVHARVCVCVRA